MKIALLMTGDCRQMWITAPSIYKNVIEPNNADVFLYLNRGSLQPNVNDQEAIAKAVFNKNVKSLIFTGEDYAEEFTTLHFANYYKVEEFYKNAGRSKFDTGIVYGTTDEYLKVKKCCEEIIRYAAANNFKYDLICRVRPDIGWLNKCNLIQLISSNTLYISNYELHNCSISEELKATNMFPYMDASFFYGSQDVIHKLCVDFSEHMYDTLELCHESHDLSLAQEKILARFVLNSGMKFNTDMDRPRMSRYYVDWRKSPNFPLVEKFCPEISENNNTYFDRIGVSDIVMDETIVLK